MTAQEAHPDATGPCPVRRVAMFSVHTSPLAQPGTGDAGGMNVYVLETARELVRRGIEVEVFTRRTSSAQPESQRTPDGVLVRHVDAGPYEGLGKDDLPGQLCAFTAGVQRVAASLPPGHYDIIHSHYWLSGQVAWLLADRWGTPFVHSMHTMAKVKNAQLAEGDSPEPPGREIGEEQVVQAASWLVANTSRERAELVDLYDASPDRVRVVHPGVDLGLFTSDGPDGRARARAELEVPSDDDLVLFVGRIQPLKGPQVLVRAVADLLEREPDRRDRLRVQILGGPSGSGAQHPEEMSELVSQLGLQDVVHLAPPTTREELSRWYRAADVLAVPSFNESFGLVALEAEASGTPVLAAAVGGLPTAVGPGGLLVDGHDPQVWSRRLGDLLDDPGARVEMSRAGAQHAACYSWAHTADRLLELYRTACTAQVDLSTSRPLAGVPQAVVP